MNKLANANDIIKNHVLLSMGAGMVPIPGADIIALSGIQLDMLRQLCNNYEVEFSTTQIKAAIGVMVSTTITKMGARRLLKLIPGIGSVAGGIAMASMSGASTFALGEVFKAHFESGGTLLNFDFNSLKNRYTDMFNKGQQIVPTWKDDNANNVSAASSAASTSGDVLSKLKELGQLRDSGVLTEEEFATLKKKIVNGF